MIVVPVLLTACRQGSSSNAIAQVQKSEEPIHHGKTIESRFTPPNGFKRTAKDSTSFAHYLRNLPLHPKDSPVRYYNGQTKPNTNVYAAVVALPIGKKDLHQCADAVMRLRAEYLYAQKQYHQIHFNFTNGFQVDYSEWMLGKRIVVKGNTVSWKQKTQPSNTPKDFWSYLETIFTYAGTASLSQEMKSKSMSDLAIGDVFIKGGFPGHAVIVVDLAIHPETKEKVFLLAQSYMPAQEIQIINNPNNADFSPWYSAKEQETLITPEWVFKTTDLKRF